VYVGSEDSRLHAYELNPLDHLTLSPSDAIVAAGAGQLYTAEAFDAHGDSLGDVTSATTFAIDGGGSCTAASCTSTALGDHTVTGSDGAATGTAMLHVSAGAATHLVVAGLASPWTAGDAGSVTVTAKDAYGNTVTDYAGTVHFASSDGAAVLPANTTLTGGVGTFSVTLKTAGTQFVTATDTGNSSITGSQGGIVVTPAAAATLDVSGLASPRVAGVAASVTVTARDACGNTVTDYTGTVHITSTDGSAVLPANSTLTNGVGTFGVTLKTAGSQSVTAADTVTGSITGSQNDIVVDPAAASSLSVSGLSSPRTAGVAGTLTVTAFDQFGNTAIGYAGSVHFSSTDGAAVLPANSILTNGVGTFAVSLRTPGTQSMIATDTSDSSIAGTQSGIVVNPAAATTLVVSGIGSPRIAGTVGSVIVTARDPYGNTATGYAGTVHIASSDAAATLPANSTLTNGVGTFAVTLETAGTQSVSATDTGNSSITGSQGGIGVTAAAATHLVVSGLPSPRTAAVAGTITITARDDYNNTVIGYTGTVHFTSTDTLAALPANSTLTNGVGTFSVTLKTAGTQSVIATDAANPSINGSQNGIVVTPAAAIHLVVSGYPSADVAGVAHNITVTAKDAYNNTVTGYTGTVAITSTDTAAVLPASSKLTAGVHAFSVTLKTAGTRTITATDTVTTSIKGSQTGIVVSPAAATHLVVSGYPTSDVAGVAHNVTVTAKDAYNNTATGYRGTVHITTTSTSATLPANFAYTATAAGVHVFSVTLKTAGTRTVTATDTKTASVKGTQSGIVVSPAAATHLVLSGYPTSDVKGVAHTVTVTAKDAYGNTAAGYRGTVHFTSSDTKAKLPANYTFTATAAGVHTFSVTLKTAGTRSITATDTKTATIKGTESGIVVK
jgi:hypothetical protein